MKWSVLPLHSFSFPFIPFNLVFVNLISFLIRLFIYSLVYGWFTYARVVP